MTYKKILIINIFGIGDVLFTTPLITNLKLAYPKAEIGYICNRRTGSILESNADVDKIFIYERDEFNAYYRRSKLKFLKETMAFLKSIKQEGYDLVVDVSLNTFTSFASWYVGIQERVGLNYKNRGKFLTKKIPLVGYEERHVVDHYLDLLRNIGVEVQSSDLKLTINEEDASWANEYFKKIQNNSKNLIIGIVPGGGASWGKDAQYKRWSAEKYAKLADKMIEKFSAEIILFGDIHEKNLSQNVLNLMKNRAFFLCGETNIHQFAALAKKCSVVIVNDGGPLHICVAAGAKTVSIFGPVDERVYGPYPESNNHLVVTKNLACRPCYRRFRKASCDHSSCLNQIEVDEVLDKVKQMVL